MGVRYGGRGVGFESRSDAGEKEKHRVHKDDECGMMPRPCENGELRTRYRQHSQGTQRNDPACIARSTKHRAWDMTSTQAVTITPDYLRLTFRTTLLFLSFLDHIHLSCKLKPCHTFFLQNHLLLFTRENTIASTYCRFPVRTLEYFQGEYL